MDIAIRLGELHLAQLQLDDALNNFEEGWNLARELNDSLVEARAATMSGHVYAQFDEFKSALDAWMTAKRIYHSKDLVWSEAKVISRMAYLQLSEGDIFSARHGNEALHLYESASSTIDTADTLLFLGSLEQKEKRYSDALRLYNRVLALSATDNALIPTRAG